MMSTSRGLTGPVVNGARLTDNDVSYTASREVNRRLACGRPSSALEDWPRLPHLPIPVTYEYSIPAAGKDRKRPKGICHARRCVSHARIACNKPLRLLSSFQLRWEGPERAIGHSARTLCLVCVF